MNIAMVHGAGNGRESWHYQLEAFPGAHAVNLPGHPDGELLPTIEANAAWLHEDLARHGVERPVVAGHSLGGGVALQYALDFPDDVRALVLVGSGARLRVAPAFLEALEAAVADPQADQTDPMAGLELVAPEVAQVIARRRQENGPGARLNDMRACDAFDVMPRLTEITVPLLAICGTEDVMTPPKYSEFLAAKMPNARTVIIPGGTHLVHLEQPEKVNEAMARFLEEL